MYQDECAFSIIFGDDFESMDLIANTPSTEDGCQVMAKAHLAFGKVS
jgi:hypothetical protein